ncbi:AbrB/MazE/SpoVT family DNA-binding domain-containing protein [Sphingomonas sp. LR60]|uniref:AbrB/MazE/SpoVT family DNA-binding domain-containing protein n=1 Tax=Sphingomonas sp. LR60 TaxID=3050233 RepID=UPI002FE3C30D
MSARTTLSAKGQVVIPKDVREALALRPGQQLDVIRCGDSVLLRPAPTKSGQSADEVAARVRELAASYQGPVVSIDDMNATVAEHWAASGRQ